MNPFAPSLFLDFAVSFFAAAPGKPAPPPLSTEAEMQRNVIYAFLLLGGLVVFYLGLIVFRKLGASQSPDPLSGLLGFNATDMKKRGLLSDEELMKVRAAMAKQVHRSTAAPPPGPTARRGRRGLNAEALLMSDPVVRHYEAVAGAKAPVNGVAGQAVQVTPTSAQAAPRQSASVPAVPPPADDIALPPDVLKMAELGLIAPEELDAIRARVRAKKAGLE